VAVAYLSVIVLLPLSAVVWRSSQGGWSTFWHAVTAPDARSALELTMGMAFAVVAVNGVFGTLLAWVLVRDDFHGRSLVNSLVDLPFAIPTIVAGLVLLTLYGPTSPFGIDVAYTRTGILLALMFETLPFVVRSVQPVLLELDRDMEEAASSLGATPFVVYRRVIMPNLLPAILSGGGLAFAKAIGEFGSISLISGNIPGKTQVASLLIYGQIESDNTTGATAVAVVLLGLSLAVLLVISFAHRWGTRHDR
jgi:sulfate/thiosulfate transport system permease protein